MLCGHMLRAGHQNRLLRRGQAQACLTRLTTPHEQVLSGPKEYIFRRLSSPNQRLIHRHIARCWDAGMRPVHSALHLISPAYQVALVQRGLPIGHVQPRQREPIALIESS